MEARKNNKKPIIKVRGLHKYFADQHIIKGVDLELLPGEVLVIMGPSGGGKSTFLRCLNLLEAFSAGSIEVAGIEIEARDSIDQWQKEIRAIRRQAAMVFQDFNLFLHMTVLDNIIQGAVRVKKEPREKAVAKAKKLLEKRGLSARLHDYPTKLSVGEQQQVAIARSLCMEPQVILFDDPTSALDPVLVHDLVDSLSQLAGEGIAMVIVTNEPYLARSVADRVILMEDGRWLEMAPPDEIFNRPKEERTRQFLEHIALKDIG